MKKILTLAILCLFLFLQCYSQSDFRKGFVILNNNDTIFGSIKYIINNTKVTECVFVNETELRTTTYNPEDIKAFRFADGKYYVSGFIKTGDSDAIASESAKLHISFAGHVPASSTTVAITGEEASEAGQRSLEHMLGIPFARDTIKMYQHMYPTEESLNHLFEVLLKNGTYVTPTLSVYYIPANYLSVSAKQSTLLKYISPA